VRPSLQTGPVKIAQLEVLLGAAEAAASTVSCEGAAKELILTGKRRYKCQSYVSCACAIPRRLRTRHGPWSFLQNSCDLSGLWWSMPLGSHGETCMMLSHGWYCLNDMPDDADGSR
jgi:hypothetical protein